MIFWDVYITSFVKNEDHQRFFVKNEVDSSYIFDNVKLVHYSRSRPAQKCQLKKSVALGNFCSMLKTIGNILLIIEVNLSKQKVSKFDSIVFHDIKCSDFHLKGEISNIIFLISSAFH